jgi:hypothetical protein
MPGAARLTFAEIQGYIRQWIKDTSGLEISDDFLRMAINMALVETAEICHWKVESVTPTLVAGQSAYTLEQLETGLANKFIRPLYVYANGEKLPEYDLEEFINEGCFASTVTNGALVAHTFQRGDFLLTPAPDATAVTNGLTIIYSAAPDKLTADDDTLDTKFRVQWQDTLCWMVLKRRIAGMKASEPEQTLINANLVIQEADRRLQRLYNDVWVQRTRDMKLKDRGAKNDSSALTTHFYIP